LSIEQVAHDLRELEHSADAVLPLASAASAAMSEVDRQIDESESNAVQAARLCEQVALEAGRTGDLVHRTGLEFKRIEESSTEALESIAGVSSRLEALGASVSVVDDLAEQMNLLALNAAIIAAQAGEHGKGFAVVADGVKDLAERSGVTSKELASLIRGMEDQTKNAQHTIERSGDNIDRAGSTSTEAELAAKRTVEAAQRAATSVSLGAREAADQAKTGKHVVDNLERVTEAVRDLSAALGEQARAFDPIAAHVEKVRTLTQQLERGQLEQAQRNRQISSGTENIFRTIGQLHKAQRNQAKAIDDTAVSVERLRELLREHERRLSGLVTVSERMQRPSLRN
jgi:methyl-accepting chemotaxis protein